MQIQVSLHGSRIFLVQFHYHESFKAQLHESLINVIDRLISNFITIQGPRGRFFCEAHQHFSYKLTCLLQEELNGASYSSPKTNTAVLFLESLESFCVICFSSEGLGWIYFYNRWDQHRKGVWYWSGFVLQFRKSPSPEWPDFISLYCVAFYEQQKYFGKVCQQTKPMLLHEPPLVFRTDLFHKFDRKNYLRVHKNMR